MGKYAKAIAGAAAGAAIPLIGFFFGIEIPSDALQGSGLIDEAIFTAVSSLVSAVSVYFAPKNKDATA